MKSRKKYSLNYLSDLKCLLKVTHNFGGKKILYDFLPNPSSPIPVRPIQVRQPNLILKVGELDWANLHWANW